MAFHINADCQVDRFGTNATGITDFGMDAIQVDHGVNSIKWSGLPLLYFVQYAIGDRGNKRRRHFNAIYLSKVLLDFPHRHATGIQREDLVIKSYPAGLMLANDLRLKAAFTVTGDTCHSRFRIQPVKYFQWEFYLKRRNDPITTPKISNCVSGRM